MPYEGNYSSWLEQKQARLVLEEKQESKRQKTLKKELEWVRMAPKARATKNKARLERYEQLVAQEYDAREDAADIQIPSGPPLGEVVVVAENVSKAFGDNLLFENMSFSLPRGGIVGVIGPNGAGKTTLFRMIIGGEKPDTGTLRIGSTVMLSYVDQSRDALHPKKTVYEEISGGLDILEVGKARIHARSYVGRFNFKARPAEAGGPASSGGEAATGSILPRCCGSGGNLLLLDEPTNDLDVGNAAFARRGTREFRGMRGRDQP